MKMKQTNEEVLTGKDIYKSFPIGKKTIDILKGVNVSIKRGEFIILFGSSGCGKSTLLNILIGLESPTTGKVLFEGKSIYDFNEDERSQIRKEGVGLIYQQQNWVKSLNVIENVAFPLTLKGIPEADRLERASRVLDMVHMNESSFQSPMELSSGQQQRVSFSRALISEPTLLVADEPTGNLDSKSSIDLMELFAEYNNKGNTIIMVTHDLMFLPYATRSLQMVDGLIVQEYKRGDKGLEKYAKLVKR
jgi:putative ABC transport system ATP-binding protein